MADTKTKAVASAFCFSRPIISDIHRILELMEHVQKTGEITSPKLAALQTILQSEFFNAVREVYETVYEIVDIEGSPEVNPCVYSKFVILFIAGALTECQFRCVLRQQPRLLLQRLRLLKGTHTHALWNFQKPTRVWVLTSWEGRSKTLLSIFRGFFAIFAFLVMFIQICLPMTCDSVTLVTYLSVKLVVIVRNIVSAHSKTCRLLKHKNQ